MSERGSRLGPRRTVRAQSNVVATVLLVFLVVTGASVVVLAGGTVLDEREQRLSYSSAVESMQAFDAAVERAANGGESESTAPLESLRGEYTRLDDDTGTISIEVVNRETSTTVASNSKTLGVVVYEREGKNVAFQGGGVFAASGDKGSAVVSSPPVEYRDRGGEPTLTLPVIAIEGDSIDENAGISRTSTADFLSIANPVPRDHKVVITVQSEYYRAWGAVFEERVGADVTYNDAAETVSLKLVRPAYQGGVGSVVISSDAATGISNHGDSDSYDSTIDRYAHQTPGENGDIRVDGSIELSKQNVEGELHATEGIEDFGTGGSLNVKGEVRSGPSTSGTLEITSGGVQFWDTFSTHDSLLVKDSKDPEFDGKVIVGGNLGGTSGGAFTTTNGIDGDVHVHGDADIADNTDIGGDLIVDGTVDLGSNVDVAGDLVASGTVDGDCNPTSDGNVAGTIRACDSSSVSSRIDAPLTPQVPSEPHAKDRIQQKGNAYDGGENDNGDDADISSNSLTYGGDDTLESGNYYFNSLTVSSPLTLDTASGDIEIYVDGNIDIQDDITVKGPNEVRIYTAGTGTDSFYLDANVIVRDQSGTRTDKSRKLWVYARPDADIHIHTGSTFTGVIYGAADSSTGNPGASITIENNVEVFGALVGDIVGWSNGAEVHYDEALAGETVLDRGISGGPPKIAYVQTTSRTVAVD